MVRAVDTMLVEKEDGVVTITLNKPEKKNAVSREQWPELERICVDLKRDTTARAVILTGAGGDFCSGADLWQAPGETPGHPMAAMRSTHDAVEAFYALPQPTIAKVPGVAAGVGLSLMLAADLAVASSTARFSTIFVKRGLALDGGQSWLLTRMVGLRRAKELALFADMLSAEEALADGLINRVVPPDELDGFVDDWATRLAAGPPIAQTLIKRQLNNAALLTFEQALEDEGRGQAITLQSRDTAEAIRSFVTKETPTFEGL